MALEERTDLRGRETGARLTVRVSRDAQRTRVSLARGAHPDPLMGHIGILFALAFVMD